jgi:hypothetical protein
MAVGGFTPLNVGVGVKVRVGVTGVAVGRGVYVFVAVNTGVVVGTGSKNNCSIVQAESKMAQRRSSDVFFMVFS